MNPILRPKYILDETILEKNISKGQILGDIYFFLPDFYLERLLELKEQGTILSIHLLGLNIVGEELDERYLKEVDRLVQILGPSLVSDHICTIKEGADYIHDLSPVPYNIFTINKIKQRVAYLSNRWGVEFICENPSLYIYPPKNRLFELDFLGELADTGVKLLFDVNNYIGNQKNCFQTSDDQIILDLKIFFKKYAQSIREIHMIGPGDYIIDGIQLDCHRPNLSEVHSRALELCKEQLFVADIYFEWENAPDFKTYWNEMINKDAPIPIRGDYAS